MGIVRITYLSTIWLDALFTWYFFLLATRVLSISIEVESCTSFSCVLSGSLLKWSQGLSSSLVDKNYSICFSESAVVGVFSISFVDDNKDFPIGNSGSKVIRHSEGGFCSHLFMYSWNKTKSSGPSQIFTKCYTYLYDSHVSKKLSNHQVHEQMALF